jgi:hypothetical protein
MELLKVERSLIAIDSQSSQPKNARITHTFNATNPDRDLIETLNSDLITGIGVDDPFQGRYPEGVTGKFYPRPESINDLLITTVAFSNNFGLQFLGRQIAQAINSQIGSLLPVYNQPRVLAILWDQPLRVASNSSLIGDMIAVAGGQNIIESEEPYPEIDAKRLLGKEPDIIVMVNPKIRSRLMATETMKILREEKEMSVISDIDPDSLLTPGPGIIRAIKALNERFRDFHDKN